MHAYNKTQAPRAKLGLVVGAVIITAPSLHHAAATLFNVDLRAIV